MKQRKITQPNTTLNTPLNKSRETRSNLFQVQNIKPTTTSKLQKPVDLTTPKNDKSSPRITSPKLLKTKMPQNRTSQKKLSIDTNNMILKPKKSTDLLFSTVTSYYKQSSQMQANKTKPLPKRKVAPNNLSVNLTTDHNNVTIKSNDCHQSPPSTSTTIQQPLSTKNGFKPIKSVFQKESLLEQYSKIVPKAVASSGQKTSNVHLNQSNSRFNVIQRPKNPADSSVSSKGSLDRAQILNQSKSQKQGNLVPTLQVNIAADNQKKKLSHTIKTLLSPKLRTKPVIFQLESMKAKLIESQKIKKVEMTKKKSGFLDHSQQDETDRSIVTSKKKLNEVVEEQQEDSQNQELVKKVLPKPEVTMEKRKQMQNCLSQQQLVKALNFALNTQNSQQSLQPSAAVKDEEISQKYASLKQQLKTQIQSQHAYTESPPQNLLSNPQQPSSQIGVAVDLPMSGRQALLHFTPLLTDYEKSEIVSHPLVYFVGTPQSAKIQASSSKPMNCGFDDERGDYNFVMNDHIGYRYEVIDKLGSGSFGQALKCIDHKNQQVVAVKVIRNKKRFQHQAGIELKILKMLNDSDKNDEHNVVRMLDYDVFRKHLIITFELLSMNLYEFIKANNFQGVSLGLVRRFAIQILQALKFQRDMNVVHCDLKPENILLKQPNKSGIKIIDYGSSCMINERIYTYIQSRFYRAPEIILGIPYTAAIDMWSFGCILAELYTGYPLFPGENEQDLLSYIMQTKDVPSKSLLELSTRRNLFFDPKDGSPIIVPNSRGRKRKPNTKTLAHILNDCQDTLFLDFLDKCFDWSPNDRITPLEALQHEWILTGLPQPVLIHHQQMFKGKDKRDITPTHTEIQGFPSTAGTKSITDLVNELKRTKSKQQLLSQLETRIEPASIAQSQKSNQSQKLEGSNQKQLKVLKSNLFGMVTNQPAQSQQQQLPQHLSKTYEPDSEIITKTPAKKPTNFIYYHKQLTIDVVEYQTKPEIYQAPSTQHKQSPKVKSIHLSSCESKQFFKSEDDFEEPIFEDDSPKQQIPMSLITHLEKAPSNQPDLIKVYRPPGAINLASYMKQASNKRQTIKNMTINKQHQHTFQGTQQVGHVDSMSSGGDPRNQTDINLK